jgi:restriction system protein
MMARWQMEVRHEGLGKYQVIRGDDKYVVEQKARAKLRQWDEMWERKQAAEARRLEREEKAQAIAEHKALAEERTQEAQEALGALSRVLVHTLAVDDTVDWDALKDRTEFAEPPSQEPAPPSIPPEPQSSDPYYSPKLGAFDKLLGSRKASKEQEAQERFNRDHQRWEEKKTQLLSEHQARMEEYEAALAMWEKERDAFLTTQAESNAAIDAQRADYQRGDAGAVMDYCDLVLANSQYPDYFPQTYELDYNSENKILILDYQLPSLTDLPTLSEVRYIQSRDEFAEKHISQTQLNQTFNELLYQITLRTMHELFEADQVNALAAIVFNGYVRSIDPATGQEISPCILSVQAGKEEFERINLASVDPKACFKSLKGIGSAKLQSMTPVAPLLRITREDARFVAGYGVVDALEEGDNLAAMDWEDFEHLIREVFEKEFSSAGGEVRVTRASRDGGVDAVAFDPDPIRGGKIVIQAKRYTGTVGVSYVRDLYGTVVNEGANKGILVTTAHYGPDAYEFAKGKPLVLLDGNNLLHLLEKHGHKARINLQEARKLLAEK